MKQNTEQTQRRHVGAHQKHGFSIIKLKRFVSINK